MTEAVEAFAPFHHHDCQSKAIEKNGVSSNHLNHFHSEKIDIALLELRTAGV